MAPVVALERTCFAAMMLCFLALTGCASTAPPTSGEIADAQRRGLILVLLRVVTKSSTGESIAPFENALIDDNIGVAIGSFETGGKVRRLEDMRFLSERSRAAGWFFAQVPKGTHYFAFLPPRRNNIFSYLAMFNRVKKWRLDVPAGANVVYAGSLVIEGEAESLLFGGKYMKTLERTEVVDETSAAKTLVQRYVPNNSAIVTALMVAHEGPVILTTPTD